MAKEQPVSSRNKRAGGVHKKGVWNIAIFPASGRFWNLTRIFSHAGHLPAGGGWLCCCVFVIQKGRGRAAQQDYHHAKENSYHFITMCNCLPLWAVQRVENYKWLVLCVEKPSKLQSIYWLRMADVNSSLVQWIFCLALWWILVHDLDWWFAT